MALWLVLSACINCSPKSKITPIKPIIRPAIVDLLLRFSFHLGLSRITNQMAAEATIMATRPLGINCSTQMTIPFPTPSIRKPLIAAYCMFFLSKIFSPLKRHHDRSKAPATRKRKVPRINGGKPARAF
ncbi:hypothetical protein D3C85_1236580 [compost metagenome]